MKNGIQLDLLWSVFQLHRNQKLKLCVKLKQEVCREGRRKRCSKAPLALEMHSTIEKVGIPQLCTQMYPYRNPKAVKPEPLSARARAHRQSVRLCAHSL